MDRRQGNEEWREVRRHRYEEDERKSCDDEWSVAERAERRRS